MALSDDLRKRVVEAVIEGGLSRNAAARRFEVSIASAVRWVKRYETTGSGRRDHSERRLFRPWCFAVRLPGSARNDQILEDLRIRSACMHPQAVFMTAPSMGTVRNFVCGAELTITP